MPSHRLLALALAGAVLHAGAVALVPATGTALAQGATKTSRAMELDAGADSSSPDPLTPPEVQAPPPAAPGQPVELQPVQPAAVDPVVERVREQLAVPAKATAGEKEDFEALVDFYAGASTPVFVDATGLSARGRLAMQELAKADEWGLKASAFELPKVPGNSASLAEKADAEIKLAIAVLTYARHARGGRFQPVSISRLFDQKPSIYDPKTLIRAVAASSALDAYLRDLHPTHQGFHNLRKALLRLREQTAEVQAPPSVQIPAGPSLRPGQKHAHIALLRERLLPEKEGAGGDGIDNHYDEELLAAVKAFQRGHKLEANGIVNAATRQALNGKDKAASREDEMRRIVVNMERWRWLPADLGPFYVWDSVPEQMTRVFHDGKELLSERIVVGKINTPTVMFSADMQFVIFHPSWGVPPGMKTQELAPQLRNTGGGWFSSNPLASQVLAAHGLQVSRGGVPVNPDSIDWSKADVRSFDFTQPPGPRNVLGIVKFRFPNKHDIYMHDTPERHLFGGAVRAFSHGCMRVQNPLKLAEVILSYDKGYDAAKVAELARRGGEIKLGKRVPVHITYFTAVADEKGDVTSFADIYSLDGRVASAIEGHQVRLAGVPPPTGSIRSDEERRERRPKKERAARKKSSQDEFINPFSALFGN